MRDRKKASKASSIGEVMNSSLAHLGIESKLKEFNIKKAWPEIAGEAVARRSMPERLIGGSLHLTVSSAPWMAELSFQKTLILKKINDRFPGARVNEIIFKTGRVELASYKGKKDPVERRPLTDEDARFIDRVTGPVKDEALKTAIKRAMEKAKT